jgi:hypothetical protein
VETLEFGTSLILVPLLCGLKNHNIIGSTLLVAGYPMIFYILHSLLTVLIDGAIVGVSYVTAELHSKFRVAFNAIHGIHQPSINLKT